MFPERNGVAWSYHERPEVSPENKRHVEKVSHERWIACHQALVSRGWWLLVIFKSSCQTPNLKYKPWQITKQSSCQENKTENPTQQQKSHVNSLSLPRYFCLSDWKKWMNVLFFILFFILTNSFRTLGFYRKQCYLIELILNLPSGIS